MASSFEDLDCLSAESLAVLHELGFISPTPVQAAVLPILCKQHKDLAVDACTGSGKTLAYMLPLIERLRRLSTPLEPQQVGAMVVSPTRELASQIHGVAQPLVASVPGLTSALLVGGSPVEADVASFKASGAHVLIGTPGRLWDLMQRCEGAMQLSAFELLVLDEADRLLDMGFRKHLDAVMAKLPKQRRTGLFSATQTAATKQLARAGLRNPLRVNVAVQPAAGSHSSPSESAAAALAQPGEQVTPSSLSIQYQVCGATEKLAVLAEFLQAHAGEKVIVYMLTCACVDHLTAALARLQLPLLRGVRLTALHGRMKQAAREATLQAFAEQPAGCLLCTDVAARGLDIPNVAWIVQFDPPQDPSTFVHRVGRTARMGRIGNALALLLPHEEPYVEFLRLRKVPMQLREAPPAPGAAAELATTLRRAAEQDRAVMEAATRAFVSFVRGYKEHQCSYIFRLPELDMGALGTALGLLRLPGMAEVRKGRGVQGFKPSAVDPDSVAFQDKARQKQWVKEQARRREQAAQQAQVRQQQRAQGQRQQGKALKRLPAAKRRLVEDRQDVSDFAKEAALIKKLKRGKISQEEFDVAIEG